MVGFNVNRPGEFVEATLAGYGGLTQVTSTKLVDADTDVVGFYATVDSVVNFTDRMTGEEFSGVAFSAGSDVGIGKSTGFTVTSGAVIAKILKSGREDFPAEAIQIKVSTVADLAAARLKPYADIVLLADIDLSEETNFEPIGTLAAPFKGNFYGNGHVISGLTQTSASGELGFFGVLSATDVGVKIIDSVSFENVNLVQTAGYGSGALAGIVQGDMSSDEYYILNRCSVDTGVISGGPAGGLVGSFVGRIKFCKAVNVVISIPDSLTNIDAGGLVGYLRGEALNCLANASIQTTGSGDVLGGLVGTAYAGSLIQYCVSVGDIVGGDLKGGTLGTGDATVDIVESYAVVSVAGGDAICEGLAACDSVFYDSDFSNATTSTAAVGKTTEEMKTEATFVGWDFEDVWEFPIVEVLDGYPELKTLF